MTGTAIRAAAAVFLASFCTLVVELVAGRILAPYVGVSLYTWTSIIGVVLAGISAGAWAGGAIADRRPQASTLGWLLLASGIASIVIAPATNWLAADDGLLTTLGLATTLLQRVVVLSFLLFFLPAFLMGMISPVAVRLAVRDLDTTGRVVGKIYAFSTLGSIAGTFATGFWFVAAFGTRATLVGVGVVLIASAFLLGDLLGRRGAIAAGALIVVGVSGVLYYAEEAAPPYQVPLVEPAGTGVVHTEESQYYTISVEKTIREDNGAPLHALHLDHLVHSYTDVADPAHLEYHYLRVFQELIDWRAVLQPSFRLLFVGGGGYTLPRLVDETHPAAEIDVVEIDPAVTRVAHRYFGLKRGHGIRTINEDARWYAMRADETYDIIFIDAFNDLSVPYHLTTFELARLLKERLAPGGALAANVIDDYGDGRFLVSYVRTLQEVFGANNVAVLMEGPEDKSSSRSTFVVLASTSLPRLLAATTAYVLPHEEMQRHLLQRKAIVLKDDYAPVDNMLAPMFAERFVDEIEE